MSSATERRPHEHRLKCWPDGFTAILAGAKRCEFRKDDRGFGVGDKLILEEWEPDTKRYTGAVEAVRVTHILRGGTFGVPLGYVVMSIRSDG